MSAALINFIDKGVVKKQEFTSDGTFNVPKGVSQVFVEGSGGGQAGGIGQGSSPWAGGRGGNGAMGAFVGVTVTPEAAIPVTIGAGGVSATQAGGNSSFGSVTFLGAGQNNSGFEGGDGGTGINGGAFGKSSQQYLGGNGGAGDGNPTSTGGGGGGGAGHWGAGGDGGDSGTSGLDGGTSGGGGGSGTSGLNTWGEGGPGKIIVYWVEPE